MTTLATPPRPACKLCELPSLEGLVSGARFGVVGGGICRRCYRERINAESARFRATRSVALVCPPQRVNGSLAMTRRLFLEVLDPDFTLDDLTPRSAVRVILADRLTRRVFFGHRSLPCSGGRSVLAAGGGASPSPAAMEATP